MSAEPDTQCPFCRHRRHVGSCANLAGSQFGNRGTCGCHVDADGNPDEKYLERELERRKAAGEEPTAEEWAAVVEGVARRKAEAAEKAQREVDEFAPPLTGPLPSPEVRGW